MITKVRTAALATAGAGVLFVAVLLALAITRPVDSVQPVGPARPPRHSACDNWQETRCVGDLAHGFLGDRRGDYIEPDMPVDDQWGEGSSAPGPTYDLHDGGYVLTGCRAHSCEEKSAIFFSPQAQVRAVVLIHWRCRLVGPANGLSRKMRNSTCDDAPHATVFVKHADERVFDKSQIFDWIQLVHPGLRPELIWLDG